MITANKWIEYHILETSDGEKLEDWNGVRLIRPDPQVIWSCRKTVSAWKLADAHYHRSSKGGGEWENFHMPQQWDIHYTLDIGNEKENGVKSEPERCKYNLTFRLKPFSFKHTGLFPEQAANWDRCAALIKQRVDSGAGRPRVLNLFAYTGGATLAAAASGAFVTHVDASKGIIGWAKENAAASGIPADSVRWLCDDCRKFVEREIRRGNSYDAIVMDPPSYGRGANGEVWKMENDVFSLIRLCSNLLSSNPLFFLISSYTTGLQPGVLSYMLKLALCGENGGHVEADELGLPVTGTDFVLPCGASGFWFP